MGSWGIKSHESDSGLDMLAVAKDRCLQYIEYKTFHIKHITELLRTHIVDKFVKESQGWDSEYIDFFYDYTFPYRFAEAVILVAECFAEYRQKGTYLVYDYKTKMNWMVAEFIYTDEVLETLCTELKSTLDHKHPLYDSWKDSELFNEWQAHIQLLCDTLAEAIIEGGGGNG